MLFTGTGVAVVSPFTPEGKLDTPALRKIAIHLIQGGVEYLVALGTTGETPTLSTEERKQVLEALFEATEGIIGVVIGVGGNHTKAICAEARHISQAYPAKGLLSVSPYYNKPSQEGIYQHYRALADSTDLPIILYNVPGRTASNIAADTVLRLAEEVPHIIAVKEASGDLEQGMRIIAGKPEGFQVLSGDDLLALPQIAAGYEGVISVAANAWPDLFSEMVRKALKGDFEAARAMHYRLQEAMRLNFVEGNPVGVKCAMDLLQLCHKAVRLPLVAASPGLEAKMREALP